MGKNETIISIIVAIIGVIVAVATCIAAWLVVPEIRTLFNSQKISTSSSPSPKGTDIPINISTPSAPAVSTDTPVTSVTLTLTYTLSPTVFVPSATNTPLLPTSTIVQDTPAGSILDVGQTWKSEGIWLTLGDAKLYPSNNPGFNNGCRIGLDFYLENKTLQDRVIEISESLFSISDNLGNLNIKHGVASSSYPCPAPGIMSHSFSKLVKPGERFPSYGYWYVGAVIDITNTSLDYILVTVNDLSNIKNATWKIPIYH
jgi:hypothetical protein